MQSLLKLKSFLRPYWQRSLGALVLLSAVVLMDLALPWLIRIIIDQGVLAHNRAVVLHTAGLMLGMSFLNTIFAIGNNYLSVQVGEGVARDLREALFIKIQNFSFGNIDRHKTGRLMVRLTSDVNAFKQLTQISLRIGTRAPLLFLGSLILMFSTNPSLALMILPVLIVTSLLIGYFIYQTEPLFQFVQTKLDALNSVLQENIAGVRLIKAFVRGDFEAVRFERANEELAQKSTRVMQFMAAMSPTLILCVNIGMVVVLWAGGKLAIKGQMSVGQIVAFNNYLLTTMIPLIMMTMLATVWAAGFASAKRVNEILDDSPEIADPLNPLPWKNPVAGAIQFEHVSFHYPGQAASNVLEDIHFTIEPQTTVAILGATGSGKSTLLHLVARFYDASAGRICLDGIDVRDIAKETLLSHLGIVPQESILFSGSVRDNIRYGYPEASDAEVIAAAKTAMAHDFIMELPQGYDSHVEQRGNNFSGGQKQRLAIARAILPHPGILLLDDSTSAVDVETEIQIQAALANWPDKPTILMVAQRISTVLNADMIIVIDQGKITATGTHDELLASSPIYQEIYHSQLGDGSRLEADLAAGQEGAQDE
jgi:ATP-binding cassette subfamily B protein